MKAMKYQKKSLIKLEDLLRRRKSNLKKFLQDRGITNYTALEQVCSRLGVLPPTPAAFEVVMPSHVSDPASGVIVVPPLDVIHESTGERENSDETFEPVSTFAALSDDSIPLRKRQKKKAVDA